MLWPSSGRAALIPEAKRSHSLTTRRTFGVPQVSLSVILAIAFLVTFVGPLPLYVAIVCGLVALVIGIIALKRRQPKVPALIGLIAGGLVVLLGLVLIIFALLFVGAFTAGMG